MTLKKPVRKYRKTTNYSSTDRREQIAIDYGNVYMPSEAEILKATEKIREGWSEAEVEKRCKYPALAVEFSPVKDPYGSYERLRKTAHYSA